MAKWLTKITKDPYDAKHLPRFKFKFNKQESAIRFRVTSSEEIEVIEDKIQTLETDLSKSQLEISDSKEKLKLANKDIAALKLTIEQTNKTS